MRIVVLESDPGSAGAVRAGLEQAGHTVVRCHDPQRPTFPCAGIEQECPLDGPGADAAVVVRSAARQTPTGYENGVTCAVRQRVPLVVVSPTGASPYARYAEAVLDGEDVGAVVAAVAQAATGRSAGHEAAATAAVHQVLAHHGIEHLAGGIAVEVRRSPVGLDVRLRLAPEVSPALRGELADRVHAAVRAYDPAAHRLDVGVVTED